MGGIRGQEILLLFLIVMLLFGAARLPKLARSMREARDEFQKGNSEKAATDASSSTVPEAHTANPEPAETKDEQTPEKA